jgi:hypothetical protein
MIPSADAMRIAALTSLRDLTAATERQTSARWSAALVVAAVASIPAAFYVAGLGFYLDDHYWLGVMSTSHDRSVSGLFDALARNDSKTWLRPGMYFGLAVLFRLFGTDPLPYHLFVAALVPVCAVLLYVILNRLGASRFVAVGVPIVFAAAPHYSTDRFWLASYAAPGSVALALAGIYALIRACGAQGRSLAGWLVGAGAAIVFSILSYEVVVPLLLVVVIVLWYRVRLGFGNSLVTAVSASLSLAGVLVYKAIASTTLTEGSSYQLGYQTGFLHHIGYLVSGSVKVNFGTYGLALPYVVGWIFVHRPTWSAAAASLLVGLVVLAYFARSGRELELPAERVDGRRSWRLLAAAGLALIVIGYATFLVTGEIYFTSAGIDNRVNIVAAIGVAVLAVGLTLGAVQWVSARRQESAFAIAVALLAATGTLITSTLANFWTAANTRQREVVAGLSEALPSVKLSNTTVVLDGVCPEIGPGVVFAAPYDLAATLTTRYHDPTIRAPVATAVMTAEPRGLVISTVLFGTTRPHFYPYRPRLLVYDWDRRSSILLRDAAAARRYLATTPRLSCPLLRSFVWGIHTSRFVPFA